MDDALFNIKLNKSADMPLYQQLAECIFELWESGELESGTKLPPIRKFAEHLRINNVTVVNAYKHLENRKVLYSHVGRGTFAAAKPSSMNYSQNRHRVDVRHASFDLKSAINFAANTLNEDLFPTQAFKEAFNHALDRDLGMAFSHTGAQGYLPLREAICNYICKNGIKSNLNDIQIISSTRQGIDIISRAMLSTGDAVIVEKPASHSVMSALHSCGALITPVDMHDDGMDMDMLEEQLRLRRPKLIYIMSYFQIPTCYSYSPAKKKKLLSLASKYDAYIIEEDNRSDFVYDENEAISVKSLDCERRVIYIKSFSQTILPGIRIGFMTVPDKIMSRIRSFEYGTDTDAASFMQRAFERFLSSGDYHKHVEDMRQLIKGRYETAIRAIYGKLTPYVECVPPAGGFNVWLKLKDEKISVEALAQRLVKENIVITPGALYDMESKDIPYFRLGLAGVDESAIELGIEKIGACLEDMRCNGRRS